MGQIRCLRVWLLRVLIRIPAAWRVIARICRAWFSNCARIQEFGSRWKWYSTLMRVASSLNFVGSWIFIEAWCIAIGFLESKLNTQNWMKSNFLQFRVYPLTFQKADGNASGFYKYPRADEIQTRSNPHKNRALLPPWTELETSSQIRA